MTSLTMGIARCPIMSRVVTLAFKDIKAKLGPDYREALLKLSHLAPELDEISSCYQVLMGCYENRRQTPTKASA
eukprot:3047837-Pyramimonas_sp.AAC.1